MNILSTNRGYILQNDSETGATRIFKMCNTDEQTEDELRTIVYYGGVVENDFSSLQTLLFAEAVIKNNRDEPKRGS